MKDDEIMSMFCSAASKITDDEWQFGPTSYGGFELTFLFKNRNDDPCCISGVIVLRAPTLGELTANLVKAMSDQNKDQCDFGLGQSFLPKMPALDGVTSKEDLALRLSCI